MMANSINPFKNSLCPFMNTISISVDVIDASAIFGTVDSALKSTKEITPIKNAEKPSTLKKNKVGQYASGFVKLT